MRCRIILNPVAARGANKRYFEDIKKIMSTTHECDAVITEYHGHAEVLAVEAVQQNVDVVIAVGGDGTVYQVINGILSQNGNPLLGIIPAGTCNDYIKSIRIPMDIAQACNVIKAGHWDYFDAGQAGERYFVNAAGLGFDAQVVKDLHKSKIKGKAAYVSTVLRQIFRYKAQRLHITNGREYFRPDAFMLTVANGAYYGGQFRIAPEANTQDGLLNAVLVRDAKALRRLMIFPHFFKGSHVSIPEVELFNTQELEVVADSKILLQMEGELYSPADNKVLFKIHPKRLKIFVPKSESLRNEDVTYESSGTI